jgi:serpin B
MSEGFATASITRRRTLAALLAVAVAVGACAGSTTTPGPGSSLPAFASIQPGAKLAMGNAPLLAPAADRGIAVAAEINDFGFDLLRQLDPSGNLVFSPASIAVALAMVRPGARGETATEMDKVLHSFGSDAQASELVALLESLKSDSVCSGSQPGSTCELSISNAAFSQTGWPVEQAYLDALSSRFGAGVNLLDFARDPEAARLAINGWANDATRGRITDVLPKGFIDKLTRLVLANAIYLKASWANPFLVVGTEPQPFTTSAGSVVSVPTMHSVPRIGYASDTGWRAVDLPYVGSLSMTVVVPDDMATFVASLDAKKVAVIVKQEQEVPVDLTLPRFSTQLKIDLVDKLSAMGMPTLFDPTGADLSGIDGSVPPDLHVSHVVHAANIDVDENGTTAAAATAVVISIGGAAPTATATFHVDRPFLYFIRDTHSGAILFMGRIDDPSAG